MSFGYDSNLTREETVTAKGADLYVLPQGRVWYQLSKLRLTGAGAVEWTSAKDLDLNPDLTGQPKLNSLVEGGAEWMGGRFDLSGVAYLKKTNARPTGFEVGARSVRVENSQQVFAGVKLGARTQAGFNVSRMRTTWDADQIYEGSVLAANLNSVFTGTGAEVSYSLTPLTGLLGGIEWRDEQYLLAPERDNRSTVVKGGIALSAPGLFSGAVSLGYRRNTFTAVEGTDVGGLVVAGALTHSRPSGSTITVTVSQDKSPSYNAEQRFFRSSGLELYGSAVALTRLELFGVVGYNKLSYEYPVPRYETHVRYGGGVASAPRYRTRIALRFEYYDHRAYEASGQQYSGYVVSTILVYGKSLVRRVDRAVQ